MSLMTSRVYNTTDGPLVIDAEGHVLPSRESVKGLDLDVEPVLGHLEAGRLIDTTEAKAEGADADEVAEAARLAEEEAAEKRAAAEAKAAAAKPTPPAKRS